MSENQHVTSWTKFIDAKPPLDKPFLTHPHRSDVGHIYDVDEHVRYKQLRPFETRSWWSFPHHPAEGGLDGEGWRSLETDPPQVDRAVILYPARELGRGGSSPYCVSNPSFARENAVKEGYTHWLEITEHPDRDEDERLRDQMIEVDGWDQMRWHTGCARAHLIAQEFLVRNGFEEAAALHRERYSKYIEGPQTRLEDGFTGICYVIYRDDNNFAHVRQMIGRDPGGFYLRPIWYRDYKWSDQHEAEFVAADRVYAFDRDVLDMLEGGEVPLSKRWEEAEKRLRRL